MISVTASHPVLHNTFMSAEGKYYLYSPFTDFSYILAINIIGFNLSQLSEHTTFLDYSVSASIKSLFRLNIKLRS